MVLCPANAAEAGEAVRDAAARETPLEIVGGGSKRALGRPPEGVMLDVSGIAGIVDYDPCELVLTARAGTRLADIAAVLEPNHQLLGWEPPDWRGLLGTVGEATLGGVLACNLSGPRRVRAGAARDHFLGFSAIDGMGQAWRAGGRVVKNVTGYDMCKLQAGALGTLSLLTEVSVRVLPMPEREATLLVPVAAAAAAFAVLSGALQAPLEVSGACWLPGAAAARAGLGARAMAALRVEGPAPSVAWRIDGLAALNGMAERLEGPASAALWRAVGDVGGLLPGASRCVWRVCPTPSAAASVVAAVMARFESAEGFFDWGGGLVWLSLDLAEVGADGGASVVRGAVQAVGGHATLIAAPAEMRAAVAVFETPAAAVAALQARIARGFDPLGILNRGRMGEFVLITE